MATLCYTNVYVYAYVYLMVRGVTASVRGRQALHVADIYVKAIYCHTYIWTCVYEYVWAVRLHHVMIIPTASTAKALGAGWLLLLLLHKHDMLHICWHFMYFTKKNRYTLTHIYICKYACTVMRALSKVVECEGGAATGRQRQALRRSSTLS